MAKKAPYLLLSPHGIFHFRMVPTRAMRAAMPGLPSEVRLSLRTRERREAVRQSHRLAYLFQSIGMDVKIKISGDYSELTHIFRGPSGHEERVEFTPEEKDVALDYVRSRMGASQEDQPAPTVTDIR